MKRAMHVFQARNGVQSPRFQKYLPRICKELGLPSTTLEEQERILAHCCNLPNITRRPEMLKLGRWFSWNASAEDNLDCVSGVRMILEDHVHGCSGPTVGDPDLATIAADDLHGSVAAKTHHAQTQKLKESFAQVVRACCASESQK